jgi:hypothetical protein
MIKVSNTTRSKLLIDKLNEAETDYAYIDDPGKRWIFYAGPYRKGLGHFTVYLADSITNIATEAGDALFGHQDNVRTIIYRSRTHAVVLDEPIDLSSEFTT